MRNLTLLGVLILFSNCASSIPELAPAPPLDLTEINQSINKAMASKFYFNGQVRMGAQKIDLGEKVRVMTVIATLSKTFHDKNSSRWPVSLEAQTTRGVENHVFQWECIVDSTDEIYDEAIESCLPNSFIGPLTTVDPLAKYRKSKWLADLKVMRPAVGMPWSIVKDALHPTDCSSHESHAGQVQYCTAGLNYRIILTKDVITTVHQETI